MKIYDVFKKKWLNKGTIYLYSDPHFGDAEMSEYRKITDEEQIKRINKVVKKNDTLIILGDVGDLEPVKKLNGYKVLICGNHDKGVSNYKRVKEKISDDYCTCKKCGNIIKPDLMDYYNCGDEAAYCHNCNSTEKVIYHDSKYDDNHLFDEVYEGPLFISNKLLLSHEPIDQSIALNIHGHDHSGYLFKDQMLEKFDPDMPLEDLFKNQLDTVKNNKLYHVNVSAEWINFTPVTLKSIIESGILKEIDDIHRKYIDSRKNM